MDYTYPKSDKNMDAGQLSEEIKVELDYDTRIRINPKEVWIQFQTELTSTEKATLNTLVANHTIKPTPIELELCEHFAQITAMNLAQARPLEATITYMGKQFPQKCFVTQDLVDIYQAGKLKVGDWVIVGFTENMPDKPIATQKVYKTW